MATQPENAITPMVSTPSGSRISSSAPHMVKASRSIRVTPEGMVTWVSLVQFSNMLSPMTVRSAGRVTSVSS